MRTATQGLVTAVLGILLLRIVATEDYLRYVQPWMRWPLVVTGIVLLLMSFRPALGLVQHERGVPGSSWLLVLPAVVVFAVAPPALGAYIAERRPAQAPASAPNFDEISAPTTTGPRHLSVEEFTWGAGQADDPMSLTGSRVELEGFVSADQQGGWYVTNLVIYCCAADVAVERVKIIGQPSPPRNQWVRVSGVWVEGTGTWIKGTGPDPADPASVSANEVVDIPTPKDPYS
ncbi:MAG TPA: TIGR03943 family protein [Aeromicrobium sp.]|nr:TIGR03943 family protein [Aeromicrobium sp.]